MRAIALLLAAALFCATAHAQVPPRINYQGYLTSDTGSPVNMTVSMVFKLWDSASGGTELWTETQPSVAVTNGVFNVVLGSVTTITLPFGAPYFLGVAVAPNAEMTPRQALAASPYAFRAKVADTVTAPLSVAGVIESTSGGMKFPDGKTQTKALANCSAEGDVAVVQAGAWVCKSSLPRYVDNGNGTVTDNQTGLMWEKKLASTDAACLNATQANRSPRCVQNTYNWSAVTPYTEPTGTLFSDFLQRVNGLNFAGGTTCFAGYCDWRIPTIGELRSILLAQYPTPCANPCIDAIFGPTQASYCWSASSLASDPFYAWGVYFDNGYVFYNYKGGDDYARAVRSGR